ncbi:hypothetical protein ACM7OS_20300 [Pseudomonas aeruginosa]|uniref:phosphoribosyltransferase-like protein n=1 Tax=Pseudomonas aeruginosa TaxID=287 RepID=UPI000463A018|nr:hypothetical protein [Pseudomonas aeruginosa]MBI8970367.1 hypothetical protein [Pseudomonas aeruginosa]WCY23511.1 hypothetical protein KK186_00125 [Pseudomonas aeruginosa]HBO5728522.1 hypothetical protein [Pseudomonas aeruginosa]
MGEREDLLASIANTISTYRVGEIAQPTPDHVGRWVSQFTPENQLSFLREFDHVIRQTFLTKEVVTRFLSNLVTNEKLAGQDPRAYWARANFLRVQKAGQSQKEMLSLFGEVLQQQCGLQLADCGVEGGDFIYLDDVLFTGGRVATDLQAWITDRAPANAVVHVILMAYHTSGHYYITSNRLKKAIEASGKKVQVHFWRLVELKNQKSQKDSSDVLWPAVVPEVASVQAYVASEQRFPLALRNAGGALGVFSSEQGRQLLETEFLIAGVKIRSLTQSPKDFIRPLGCGSFGVGFGSLVATYRNCPNNCPLALWWGDPQVNAGALHWYPLLARKTYAAPENIFNVLDDLTA